jgi:hypothetical protein
LFSAVFFHQCGGNAENKIGEEKLTMGSKSMSASDDSLSKKTQPNTRQIDTSTANNAVKAYVQHEKKLMIKTPEHPGGEVLRGYTIKMSNIEKLLSKNPDQLFLEFAVFPDSLNSPADNQHFTLIISGYKNGQIIRDKNTVLLYEYLRPCPPNGDCP